ncbi:MAG TPA: hypothetical protein VHR72_10515 [Gemmataceae bacterium]|nr:hypothetical protein [Gemmataceae bacterium]
MTGESTFVVDLKITTWINEATAVRRVVSNRWTSIREINDCFWARLIISGITRFRSDAMRMPDGTVLSPDQFLQSATPPVPNGFQRREIRAEVSSDGLQLTWAVVDSQCALMPVNRKIARIRGYYQDSYDPISAANALSMGTAGAEIGTMVGGLIGGVVGAIVGGVTGMFPKQTLTVSIRVDGHPDATPTDLAEALALCVGGLRLGGKSLFKSISSAFIHTNSLTQSLDDDSRWAQIFIQFNGSSATSGALALFGLAPGATRRYLFTDDNGNPLPPDQTGLGDPSKPNGMVALVPDNTNPANRAAKSGTPPSPQDWSRNDWYTAFMRAADVKTTEQPATSITSVAEQRTGVGVGDSKLLKDI